MIVKNIPIELLPDFIKTPRYALRQYANIAETAVDIFYHNWENIRKCYSSERNPFNSRTLSFEKDYVCRDQFFRFAHVDLAKTGNAAGIAVCHIPTFVKIPPKAELAPFVKVDFIGRILPKEQVGGYIDPAAIRDALMRFMARGFKLRLVTFDGYQSWESILRMREKGVAADTLSIDRTRYKVVLDQSNPLKTRHESITNPTAPHALFRDILSEFRLNMPKVSIIEKELQEQDDVDGLVVKIPGGTDDVLQSLVGAIFNAVNNIRPFVSSSTNEGENGSAEDVYSSMIMQSEQAFSEMLKESNKNKISENKEKKEKFGDFVDIRDDFNDLLF